MTTESTDKSPISPSTTELTTPDRPQTKLAAVREQLAANPNVFLAGELHLYHSEAPKDYAWTQTVDILVAPAAPQFDIEKLNAFMYGLVQGVELSTKDDAYSESDGGIHLGILYYDETIAKVHKTTQITIETDEPEVLLKAGKKPGKSEEKTEELRRRTWIKVYPDPISAATAFQYQNGIADGTIERNRADEIYENVDGKYHLTGEQVKALKTQYSRSPITRIRGFLQRHGSNPQNPQNPQLT